MYWKDELARRITVSGSLSYSELKELSQLYPKIRIKTIDARKSIPLIQLEGKGDWYKAEEWAHNHNLSIRDRFEEAAQRLESVDRDRFVLFLQAKGYLEAAEVENMIKVLNQENEERHSVLEEQVLKERHSLDQVTKENKSLKLVINDLRSKLEAFNSQRIATEEDEAARQIVELMIKACSNCVATKSMNAKIRALATCKDTLLYKDVLTKLNDN